MPSIREYLLSVTAAAILCALLQRMLARKGSSHRIGKMLTGVFMSLTVLSPLTDITLTDFEDLTGDITLQAQSAVADGEETARNAMAACISETVEAYILDKALAMNVHLQVRVELTDGAIPAPCRVYLQGSVAPYAKRQLQNMIQDDLGINKENQVWT